MTRDAETFKKIDTSSMSIGEFKQFLGQDEKVGFASYLIIKNNFFGFASSSLSPKFDTFCEMINTLLTYTNNGSWSFCIHPLIHQATRDEAVKMNFIGKTTIEVKKENSLAQNILNVISAGGDIDDLDSLEITLKPIKGRSIKPVVQRLVSATSDQGVEKLVMKAKNDAKSAMLDLYVVGRGVISDDLGSYEESVISEIMETKIRENAKLKEQLEAFTEDGQTDKADFSRFLHFNNVSSWSDLACELQSTYSLQY
ncbi:hypothetical protein A9978_31635 [Pseudomonas sp. UMC65]|nr:hypothetical protein [Pseudomonas sp. UMC65]MBB1623102.1 hypothetical protein [Pseudomonas sp. UME65]